MTTVASSGFVAVNVADGAGALRTSPRVDLPQSQATSARLVLKKQLEIEKDVDTAPLATLCVSSQSSGAVVSYCHAVEVGT